MNAPNVGLSPEPQFTVDFGTVSFLTRLTMYYPPFKTGIVCGTDNDAMQLEGEPDSKMPAEASTGGEANHEKALAFVGYAQASTVAKGGDGVPTQGPSTEVHMQSHVGVHVTLCGHAIHKNCW